MGLRRPDLAGETVDFDSDRVEDLAGDRSGGDPPPGLPRGGATTAAVVAVPVLGPVGVVGVARAEDIAQVFVFSRIDVPVVGDHRDRGACGATFEDPG